jgi:tRNA uridine 5-carboxymethylaminomethyl modification enzyme
VDDARWQIFEAKRAAVEDELTRLQAAWVRPGTDAGARIEARFGPLSREQRALDLLRRPEVSYAALVEAVGESTEDWRSDERLAVQVPLQVDVQAKYHGYIERQHEEIERQRRHEQTCLPDDFDYAAVRGLSNEVRQRLNEHRPASLGQAARIPGVTPAAVSLLLIHLKRRDPGADAAPRTAHGR